MCGSKQDSAEIQFEYRYVHNKIVAKEKVWKYLSRTTKSGTMKMRADKKAKKSKSMSA